MRIAYKSLACVCRVESLFVCVEERTAGRAVSRGGGGGCSSKLPFAPRSAQRLVFVRLHLVHFVACILRLIAIALQKLLLSRRFNNSKKSAS